MTALRASPLASQIALWIAFGAIAVASVFTVLAPELSDDGDGAEESAEATAAAAD